MALEPITRQEKIIAGQDLTPITRMEKFLKQFGGSGGGGGVQSDWNQNDEADPAYVKNRTHYDTRKVFTWDGVLDEGESMPYHKTSNLAPSTEELIGGKLTWTGSNGTEERTISSDMFVELFPGVIGVCNEDGNPYIVIAQSEGEVGGVTLTKGLYFISVFISAMENVIYTSRLEYGELKPLEDKFIPWIEAPLLDGELLQSKAGRWEGTYPTELIMTSSTAGSEKKFKLTVDDSGTLTATEVV